MYIYMHVCLNMCLYKFMYIYIHDTYMHICTYIHTCVCVCVCLCIVDPRTNGHAHVNTYMTRTHDNRLCVWESARTWHTAIQAHVLTNSLTHSLSHASPPHHTCVCTRSLSHSLSHTNAIRAHDKRSDAATDRPAHTHTHTHTDISQPNGFLPTPKAASSKRGAKTGHVAKDGKWLYVIWMALL